MRENKQNRKNKQKRKKSSTEKERFEGTTEEKIMSRNKASHSKSRHVTEEPSKTKCLCMLTTKKPKKANIIIWQIRERRQKYEVLSQPKNHAEY